MLDKAERLVFTGSNSELLTIRIPKEIMDALVIGAKENGLPFTEYVRGLLHTASFYYIAMGRLNELKTLLRKGDSDSAEKMAEVFSKVEQFFDGMDAFIKEAKGLEDDTSKQRKHIKELQKRTFEDVRRILRAVDDTLPRGEAR